MMMIMNQGDEEEGEGTLGGDKEKKRLVDENGEEIEEDD